MRWFKPNLRSSIYSLLGPAFRPSQSVAEDRVEDIREAMLGLLGESGSRLFPQTMRRLRYAPAATDLWHLRPNLMAALAAMYGEDAARLKTARITLMFDGLLPHGLKPRTSNLKTDSGTSGWAFNRQRAGTGAGVNIESCLQAVKKPD